MVAGTRGEVNIGALNYSMQAIDVTMPTLHTQSSLSHLYRWLLIALSGLLFAACNTAQKQPDVIALAITPPTPSIVKPPPKIALVLGGGGTRGFAHIGVIKTLEAQGIVPDIIVGTSVGSVVGALYARGYSGFELQELSMRMEEEDVIDKSWLNSKVKLLMGSFEGEALEKFINHNVHGYTIEKLKRKFAAVATDRDSGEMIVFSTGDTGVAVHASSAVPSVFKPVLINGHYYVDGGLVRPVPVSVARSLGANFIIAVDISNSPQNNKIEYRIEEPLQIFDIMSQTINRYELPGADIVIRPDTSKIDQTNLTGRHEAVLQGEMAANAQLLALKAKLKELQH